MLIARIQQGGEDQYKAPVRFKGHRSIDCDAITISTKQQRCCGGCEAVAGICQACLRDGAHAGVPRTGHEFFFVVIDRAASCCSSSGMCLG